MNAWRSAIGDRFVVTDQQSRRDAEQCTFATTQEIPAIIYPGSTAEVQRCVAIANDFLTPIYPVSRGRNWGLGSKVPVTTGCVLMDLQRMNKIVEFNDELGYVAIQPGVTFEQVATFLLEKSAKHFLPMIGGPPDASVLANYLERGDGAGPTGERALHGCCLEVVLGRGDVIHSGFGQFPGSKVANADRWGVGPSIDGLFSQSSFGITTQLTVWLAKRPRHFQSFMFTIDHEDDLKDLVPRLRDLQSSGTIQPASISLWNAYKIVTSLGRHPDPSQKTVDVSRMLANINRHIASAKWFGIGGLYANSAKMARAQASEVRAALKAIVSRLMMFDDRKSRWLRRANSFVSRMGMPVLVDDRILRSMYDESPFLGHPTRQSIRSLYWRKSFQPDVARLDPHRDRCGVHWLCHAVPYTESDIQAVNRTLLEIASNYGLEPAAIFVGTTTRVMKLCLALHYDREIEGADDIACKCHDEIVQSLNSQGYTSCRLGIQAMARPPQRHTRDEALLQGLKLHFDPNGIVSPGRYSIVPLFTPASD